MVVTNESAEPEMLSSEPTESSNNKIKTWHIVLIVCCVVSITSILIIAIAYAMLKKKMRETTKPNEPI